MQQSPTDACAAPPDKLSQQASRTGRHAQSLNDQFTCINLPPVARSCLTARASEYARYAMHGAQVASANERFASRSTQGLLPSQTGTRLFNQMLQQCFQEGAQMTSTARDEAVHRCVAGQLWSLALSAIEAADGTARPTRNASESPQNGVLECIRPQHAPGWCWA